MERQGRRDRDRDRDRDARVRRWLFEDRVQLGRFAQGRELAKVKSATLACKGGISKTA